MPALQLAVNLTALRANYRLLAERFSGFECGAVVKANAYGLGVEAVADALYHEGCRTFFVATLEEGVELAALVRSNAMTRIFVFNGSYPGEEAEYAAHGLIPILNCPLQLERWDMANPYALHVDTGMCRLGLTYTELIHHAARITHTPQLFMSHLACANDPQHPKNAEQLERFEAARALLPPIPASLCNSSGIFLNPTFHFNLARPGCALYGITPCEEKNPMRAVATLKAPIIQIRTLDKAETVGYGATASLPAGSKLAVIQMGYADGFMRSLSNRGQVMISEHTAPVAGRVSMDMIAADVSAIPQNILDNATHVELLNTRYTVNDMALDAGTIGYEIFTRIGKRVKRIYT